MATPDLLEALEIETAPSPTAAVVWLHGLGADGHDFVDIVPMLGLKAIPTRFVFPHAPMRPVTINGGAVMRAWYDVRGDAGVRREDEAGVRESQRRVEALIAREKARGIAARRIALAGFSQGGAMVLQTGLRHPERLAGIMALSCFLPLADKVAAEVGPANRDVADLHGARHPGPAHPAGARPARVRTADFARLSHRVARVSDSPLGESRRDPRHQRVAAADFGLTTQPMGHLTAPVGAWHSALL